MIDEKSYSRIIAIGDIHGYLNPLLKMLELIKIDDNDLVVFIGDYIDRGPQSKNVIEKLIKLKFLYKNIIFLKGNHEDMLLGSVGLNAVIKDFRTWLYNGGTRTLFSYGLDVKELERLIYSWNDSERANRIIELFPKSHFDFIKDLNSYFETENYFFCHAGLNPELSIEEAKKNRFDLLWIRDHLYAEDYKWGKTVVCGHTPMSDVLIKDKLICIDTGLFCFGKLSAVDLLTKRIFQVTM